ncbi:hypothetical protein DBB29_00745 [Pandoraea cepalis]|uniref:Uncharacterized protein n=1 Tax=Pandoraea cepalis TaxID=2508294 RepID=A0AAW7MH94_9BURK|nr:hypothetical protein [Pandoraea cepalis]MDN4572010.1 hypothetical protein [Pandoraea cepalis]MDN4576661.1 hypothetical protein [Pandoraea cepalis]
MGEAKRRGSREQRASEAKDRSSASLAKIAEWVNARVDEDLYLYCHNLYAVAADMRMPVENPESRKVTVGEFGTIAFSDIPLNRGMLAVTKELEEQGMDHQTRFAMCWRIMHFGDLLAETDRLSKWIRPGEEPGALNVSEALIRACAHARIDIDEQNGSFDLDDLARRAMEIEARLDAEDSSSSRA